MVFAKTLDHTQSNVTLTVPMFSGGLHSVSGAHWVTDLVAFCWPVLGMSEFKSSYTCFLHAVSSCHPEKAHLIHVPPCLSDISQREVWKCSDNIEPYMKTIQLFSILRFSLWNKSYVATWRYMSSSCSCWPFHHFDWHNQYILCRLSYFHHRNFLLLVIGPCWWACNASYIFSHKCS